MVDNSWFQAYINDPQDVLETDAGEIVKIVPQDYLYGNTSPSAYVSGVLRDQFELVTVVMTFQLPTFGRT